MEWRLATAAPLFAFDEEMTIVEWNYGAEELTGIPREEAVGQPCWAVLCGHADSGDQICSRHCSRARLAREGWSLHTEEMHIRTAHGRRRVAVDSIAALGDGKPVFFHLMHDAPLPEATESDPPPAAGPPPRLTPRQLGILHLMGEGASARAISTKLGLTETTVRNHIRAVLLELGAHSQLEAVFRARCHGLL